jgi:hypothetical protein
MKRLESEGRVLSKEDFHSQWHVHDLPESLFSLSSYSYLSSSCSLFNFSLQSIKPVIEKTAKNQQSDKDYEALSLQGKLTKLLTVDMQSRGHHLCRTESTLGCTVTAHHKLNSSQT